MFLAPQVLNVRTPFRWSVRVQDYRNITWTSIVRVADYFRKRYAAIQEAYTIGDMINQRPNGFRNHR